MQHNYLDLLANNCTVAEEWGGAGEAGSTPVERTAIMPDWKDYWVDPLSAAHMPSHTLGLISVTDVPSVADMWKLPRWDVASRQPCLAVSPVTGALQ